ncbi:MAG TPA: hypothetical protein VLH19_00255 [Patescibacteria group bacterium]|nr:hypothetical protein [Patescibacteria group bacterium]
MRVANRFVVSLFILHVIVMGILISRLHFFSGSRNLQDFDSYIQLVGSIRAGQNPYSTNSTATLGAPSTFLLYLPFSFLKLPSAQLTFLIINIAAGYLICLLLSKKWILLSATILFSAFVTRFSLLMGQPALLGALLVTVFLLFENQTLSVLSVVGLGILKTFFFPLGIFFLSKPKVFIQFIFFSLLITVLTFAFMKISWYEYFVRNTFIPLFSTNSCASNLDYYNQSLRSTLCRLHIAFPYLSSLVSLLFIAVAFLKKGKKLWVLAIFLFSPVLWQHYFVMLFPIYVLIFFELRKNVFSLRTAACVLSFILWYIQFPYLQIAPHTFWNGVLASHYYWAALLLFFVTARMKPRRRRDQ